MKTNAGNPKELPKGGDEPPRAHYIDAARVILHGADLPDVIYLSGGITCTKDAPCGGCDRIARALAERDEDLREAVRALEIARNGLWASSDYQNRVAIREIANVLARPGVARVREERT